ncbi:hypothetical protein TVAG_043050 [Trichomonas vaginalis G3]|uniref:RRM domain-containing protein n=1 Tax=Trichomonas vaginalis (strain ATCC PRA-98 / G3) TaxID=412133 RepID=A2F6R9_TRIV3|nr:RNA binding [Trichomonas vaginalis G3]EAX99397.1 hypothetical protein TVAG_043050 [Trichomonas vaginalis G3]KAI5509275.1 RNA binding [Trichomonas vaginalis G3]|eukprot:XP_001312327.1 hypothetical protein [Trichomonas vaginalis G3]
MTAPIIQIANLPENAGEQFLRDFLADYGPIVKVVILEQLKKNTALVQLGSIQSALAACHDLNYTRLNENQLVFTPALPEYIDLIKQQESTIFISGIADGIHSDQLAEVFSNFGDVITVKIPTEEEVKGIAYVQYLYPESAQQAIEQFNGAEIQESEINIMKYESVQKHKKIKNNFDKTFTTILIQNIPEYVTEPADVGAFLIDYGTVVAARVVKTGAFATMSSHEEAVKVIKELNGKEIEGKTISVLRTLSLEEKAALYSSAQQQQRQ